MGPPTESLTTLIIVGTAASTGLIILVILNVFVCGCIVAMCMRRGRRQPTYVRCTPTLITPALAVPIVRVQQFEQDDDYTEIENVRPMQHEMTRQVQVQRVAMSQQHLAMRQWGPQNNHFASSQPYLTRGEWGSQRTAASEDNIYCSVLDSEEDLTEQPTQMPLYRELESVPMRREYSSDRQLDLSSSDRVYRIQDSFSQSGEITLI